MNESYDIIIVGAGPAGSTAARVAAENGANSEKAPHNRLPRESS